MYILKIRHGSELKDLLIFDTENEGQSLIDSFPYLKQNHYRVAELIFSDYYFEPTQLPDYFTWELDNIKIPMSRFSFTQEDQYAYFELHQLDHVKQVNKEYIDGSTRVDAWVVDNQEVKQYIESREKIATALLKELAEAGYQEIERCYFGSEDGEAIIGRKDDQTFFTHLDAGLIHDFETSKEPFEKFINSILNNQ